MSVKPTIKYECLECYGLAAPRCDFCHSCPHEKHSEECKQAWRDYILSYK